MEQTAPGDRHASVTGDSGLRCPKCEYNLTGVAENRCPECGTGIDLARLNADLALAPLDIPVLEDRGAPMVLSIMRMCLCTWFVPWRVGASFPPRFRNATVVRFRRLVFVAALGITGVPLLITGDAVYAVLLFGAVAGGGVAVHLCEWCISGMLTALLVPYAPPQPPRLPPGVEDTVHGLVTLFRSHLLITAAAATVWAHLPVHASPRSVGFWVFLIAATWWWASLSLTIAAQPARPAGKLVAILLIPPIAAGCTLLGVIIATPFGAFMLAA